MTLPDNANFCPNCGQDLRQKLSCPSCNTALLPDARFCTNCGAKHGRISFSPDSDLVKEKGGDLEHLSQGGDDAFIPDSFSSHGAGQYREPLPEDMEGKVRQSRSMMEGERKEIAVIFADISGFTAMSEELDPEEVRDLMNNCFKVLVDVIYKYEGYIDKFIGDCIMALFGAPIAHENDQERAVRSSLEMLEKLKKFNDDNQIERPLGLSIGINYGIVVTGNVGTSVRKDYTVMGDTVNLAQRLQGLAERGQILVGEKLYQATSQLFHYKAKTPITVKGKKHPVRCYEALGERKRRVQTAQLSTIIGEFQGRKPEFLNAEQLLHRIAKSKGQVIVVSGESGIGKSRFTEEMIGRIKSSSYKWQFIRGACVSHSTNISYYIFLDILRDLVQIDDDDNETELRSKLMKLKGFGLGDNEVHIIANMYSVKFDGSNIQFFNEETKKNLTFQAIKTLFFNLARTANLCIYLDDCQWLDKLSEELLDYLFASMENERILVLYTTRVKETLGIAPKKYCSHFRLLPLSKTETHALVKSILHDSKIPEEFLGMIWEKSGGNPLFIEEMIKSMIEVGTVVKNEHGHYHIEENLSGAYIPPTIQGLLAARVDKLSDDLKWTLQVLSVVGNTFSHILVSKVFNHEEYLSSSLTDLIKRDMICIVKEGKEREYGFRSSLLREVVYNSILKKKLKEIHLRVGRNIEEHFADRLEEHYLHLAYHYLETDYLDKKIFYCEKSGDKLAAEYQLVGSNEYYSSCIASIEKNIATISNSTNVLFLDTSNIREKIIELTLKIIRNYNKLGEIEQGLNLVTDMMKSLPEEPLSLNHVICSYWKGKFLYDRGLYPKAKEMLQSALKIAETIDAPQDKIIEIKCFVGATYERLGDIEMSLKELTEAMKLAEVYSDNQLIAELSNRFGITALFKGNYQEAIMYFARVMEAAEDKALKHLRMKAIGNIGIAYGFLKNYVRALEHYQMALELAMEIGDKIGISRNLHNMGELFYEMGDLEQAYSHFEKSLPISEEIGWQEGYVTNLLYVGYLSYVLLEDKQGIDNLKKAIKEAIKNSLKRTIPQGKYLLAKLLIEEKQFDEARKVIREGKDISEKTGFQKMVDEFLGLERQIGSEKAGK